MPEGTSNDARLMVYIKVDYKLNGADLEVLQEKLQEAIWAVKGKQLTEGTPAVCDTMTIGMGFATGVKPGKPTTQAVAVCGNLTEGFKLVGPFPDFDTAAEAYDGAEAWIATLFEPETPFKYAQCDPAVEEYVDGVMDILSTKCEDEAEEALDDLVHDAASQIGSGANNEGYDGQVRFLIAQWGLEGAKKQIDEVLKGLSH